MQVDREARGTSKRDDEVERKARIQIRIYSTGMKIKEGNAVFYYGGKLGCSGELCICL